MLIKQRKPFRIGLDLDGTAVEYTGGSRSLFMKLTGLPPEEFAEPIDYSFVKSGWPFKTEDEFREAHGWAVEQGLYANLAEIPGAAAALQEISEAGAHIHIITSRFVLPHQHRMVMSQTVENLDALGIPFRGISFENDKSTIMADLYVDDAPHNITSLRALGRDVLTFDALYNHDIPGPRATNWTEAKEYILGKMGV